MQALLDDISEDVRQLPVSAIQLVGALVALQDNLPPALRRFLMAQLSQRADLSVVSPAAEALMRLSAFSAYSDMEFAALEMRAQMALLKATAMEDKVLIAAAFISRLAGRVEAAFNGTPGPMPATESDRGPQSPYPSNTVPRHEFGQ